MMNIPSLIDKYGREHHYLQISVTDRCNGSENIEQLAAMIAGIPEIEDISLTTNGMSMLA